MLAFNDSKLTLPCDGVTRYTNYVNSHISVHIWIHLFKAGIEIVCKQMVMLARFGWILTLTKWLLQIHHPFCCWLILNQEAVKWKQVYRFSTCIGLATLNTVTWQYSGVWASHPERRYYGSPWCSCKTCPTSSFWLTCIYRFHITKATNGFMAWVLSYTSIKCIDGRRRKKTTGYNWCLLPIKKKETFLWYW